MGIRRRTYRRLAAGGTYRGPYDYTDSTLIDPRDDPKNKAIEGTGTGAAGGIAGYWGALAGVGTSVSKSVRGNSLDRDNNIAANYVNPFNQFEDNKGGAEWIQSFVNPFKANIDKANLQKNRQIAYNTKLKGVANKNAYGQSSQILNTFDTVGGNETDLYHGRFGGQMKKLTIGGELKQLSEENQEVEGNSHEQGGVKFPKQGIELEGGETLNDGDFVFSKELGFADLHKPIARAIGKMEKKPQTMITINSISRLKAREEQLKQQQESLKQELGLGDNLASYMTGGQIGGDGHPMLGAGRVMPFDDGYVPHYTDVNPDSIFKSPPAVTTNSSGGNRRGYHLFMRNGGGIPNPNFHFYQTYQDGGSTNPYLPANRSRVPSLEQNLSYRPTPEVPEEGLEDYGASLLNYLKQKAGQGLDYYNRAAARASTKMSAPQGRILNRANIAK